VTVILVSPPAWLYRFACSSTSVVVSVGWKGLFGSVLSRKRPFGCCCGVGVGVGVGLFCFVCLVADNDWNRGGIN
jgi:VIT1/CCC1 family predicted Fe2+/Mn2+ transporter